MAVLCLMSRGGEGYLYGTDGGIIDLSTLIQNMNDYTCKNMNKKPKFIVIECRQDGEDKPKIYLIFVLSGINELVIMLCSCSISC